MFTFVVLVFDDPVFVGFLNIVICFKQFVAISCEFYSVLICAMRVKLSVSVMLSPDLAGEFFNVFNGFLEGWD